MDRRSPPIPGKLLGVSFSAEEARAEGIGYVALQNQRFEQPFRGVWRVAPSEARSYQETQHITDALAFASRLRDADRFSHTTALLLLGAPIRYSGNIHVSTRLPEERIQRRQVHKHQSPMWCEQVPDYELSRTAGRHLVRTSSPWVALVEAANTLDFTELLVAADHFMREDRTYLGEPPDITPEDIERCIRNIRARGIRKLRAVLGHATAGADSRYETLTRLELLQLGVTTFKTQVDLYDERGFIGRFDLVDEERRLIIEYDGEQHRTDDRQYAKDEERIRRAFAAGWRVLRLRKNDFAPNQSLAAQRKIADFMRIPARAHRLWPLSG